MMTTDSKELYTQAELKARTERLRQALDRNDQVDWESHQFEMDSHNALIHSPEETQDPKTCYHDKLPLLLTLCKIGAMVDHPIWAVSDEEIAELLIDLGCSLQNASQKLSLNDEVFEDPLNRSDVLGNVTMFHTKRKRQETQSLMHLGVALIEIADLFLKHQLQANSIQQAWEEISHDLDQFSIDDHLSSDILAAKRQIIMLRKSNMKLDRRNERLWMRLKRKNSNSKPSNEGPEERATFLKQLVDNKTILSTFHNNGKHEWEELPFVKMFMPDNKSLTDDKRALSHENICTVRDDEMLNTQSRKLEKRLNVSSQKDGLTW